MLQESWLTYVSAQFKCQLMQITSYLDALPLKLKILDKSLRHTVPDREVHTRVSLL